MLTPYSMKLPADCVISDPYFLRMQVELHFAQDHLGSEFRTLSGRHLYFNIARLLLAQKTQTQDRTKFQRSIH